MKQSAYRRPPAGRPDSVAAGAVARTEALRRLTRTAHPTSWTGVQRLVAGELSEEIGLLGSHCRQLLVGCVANVDHRITGLARCSSTAIMTSANLLRRPVRRSLTCFCTYRLVPRPAVYPATARRCASSEFSSWARPASAADSIAPERRRGRAMTWPARPAPAAPTSLESRLGRTLDTQASATSAVAVTRGAIDHTITRSSSSLALTVE